MSKLRSYYQKHPKAFKTLILSYVIFAGCTIFPFGTNHYPFGFIKAYLVLASYGIIGLGFAAIYKQKREKLVYLISLALTAVGLACRFWLEYGEVSNTYNFTPFNIFSYLLIIPILITFAYWYWGKLQEKSS